ncbi:AfsR/SARP family transcriptional regulator [Flindersiella endophytica]
MRFRVLGPLRVWNGADWSTIPARQQRVVLAVLLAERGRTVSTDRLIQEIWGDQPPRTASNTLHRYIAQLRRLIGGDSAYRPIVTRDPGYQLALEAGELDAQVLADLVDSAKEYVAQGRLEDGVGRYAEALELWTGAPLSDVPESPGVRAEAARLNQLRLAAEAGKAAAQMGLGRDRQAVADLQRLVAEHPLDERLRADLMVCLYRCGLRAEALDVYRDGRRVMVAELGLEPGPELSRLEQAILNDDPALLGATAPAPATPAPSGPATQPVPAQLPAPVTSFTGRTAELLRLDAGTAGGDALVIATITGPAGVGKTALAVHWTQRVRARFPDGQLYVNLRAYSPTPDVSELEALSRFLRALNVPAEQVPGDLDEAGALYRSLLAGKRVLVVLDNAASASQVRPLLPGSPGCVALITSRARLTGLVAKEGAIALPLEALTDGEAYELLRGLLGDDRVADEASASGELARLCGNLPLALRIAAANLSTARHVSIADHVRSMAGNRLDALEIHGAPNEGVRAALDLSCATLGSDARRLFVRLSLVPGPDVTTAAAAVLVDSKDMASVQHDLDQLTSANLVADPVAGRYTLHDLVRAYAVEKAVDDESSADREEALGRLYDYYLEHVLAAAELLYPEMLRLPRPEDAAPAPDAIRFGHETEALAWLDDERSNLVAAIVYTAQAGPREVAYRLADALRGYLLARMLLPDWEVVVESALSAATACDDVRALAATHLSVGMLHSLHERTSSAIDALSTAATYAREAGWKAGECVATGNMGGQYWMLGQLELAAKFSMRSLRMRRRLGWRTGEASAVGDLGMICWGLGKLEDSAGYLTQAVSLYSEQGLKVPAAKAGTALGITYHALGRLDDALDRLSSSLTVLRDAGDRYFTGYTMAALTELYLDLGKPTAAFELAAQTVELADQTGHQHVKAMSLSAYGEIMRQRGDHPAALEAYRGALTIADKTADSYGEAEARLRLAVALFETGRLEEAADLVQQSLTTSRLGGYRLLEGQALVVLAAVRLGMEPDAGGVTEALDLAAEAARIQDETGHRLGQARALLVCAHGRRLLGAGAEAETDRRAAHKLLEATGHSLEAQLATLFPRRPRPEGRP